MGDLMPVFDVVESPGGLYIGARRNAEDGKYYWRITQWVMPSFTMIPPRGDHPVHGHFFIPMDDENSWAWSFDYHADRPLTDEQVQAMREGKGIHTLVDPKTFRPLANKDNDYLMDRKAQKAGRTYGGIAGFAMQDASIQESMGPIVDRSRENLVGTDKGIVMARRRLLRAAKALAEQGTVPPGVEVAHQRVRSASVVLPPDQPFATAVGDALAAKSWRGSRRCEVGARSLFQVLDPAANCVRSTLLARNREFSNEGIAAIQPECQVLDPWERIAFATVCSFEIAKISVDAASAERLISFAVDKTEPWLTRALDPAGRDWIDCWAGCGMASSKGPCDCRLVPIYIGISL